MTEDAKTEIVQEEVLQEKPHVLSIKLPIPGYPYAANVSVLMVPELYNAIMEKPEEERNHAISTVVVNMLDAGLSEILKPASNDGLTRTESGLIIP